MDVAWPELVTQNIKSWGGWPDDVRDILRAWNKQRRLAFVHGGRCRINGVGYFTCEYDCKRFIRSLGYMDAKLDGRLICEDCLIEIARA